MKSRQQQNRYSASRRWQAPDPSDLVWKQWGQALIDQYAPEDWPARIAQIPAIYRPLVTARLIRDFGYKIEA